ncbi:TPA: winged helix-turn-helix domain-containing protein, partial [Klebsiella aerogenes]|nr:winged helix-turn-helix domain-containing protein [Klebsiella aerogenes]
MKILINEIIEFTYSSGVLTNIKTHNSHNLSYTNSQILLRIINNGKNITSREEIFSDIFRVTNAKQTDGNLNQCIASIRRAFNELVEDNDIIVTIPKIGFYLDKDVSIT